MEKLLGLIDNGWSIKIYNQLKRISPPGGGGRAWVIKVCWEADRNDLVELSDDENWEGFETAKEAIDDLVSKIKCVNEKKA